MKNFKEEMGTIKPKLKEENAGSNCRMDQNREWRLVPKGYRRGNRKEGMLEKAGSN